MREVFVDDNRTGWPRRARIVLFRWERKGIEVGEIASVYGDSVNPRRARVTAVELDYVETEFLEELAA